LREDRGEPPLERDAQARHARPRRARALRDPPRPDRTVGRESVATPPLARAGQIAARRITDRSARILCRMLFSTKAEYGVRLMVELGRRTGADPENSQPVSLTAVAEAEALPLSYLEHLVAKLRMAGLVTSVRGAHGG